MIYILKIWLKPCPKRQVFWVWREYVAKSNLSVNQLGATPNNFCGIDFEVA